MAKKPSKIRLDRLLSNLGYGSRKDIAWMMRKGLIEPQMDVSTQIDLQKKEHLNIKIDGEELDPIYPFSILLHKPKNYTCSHDEDGLLIYDLLPTRFANRDPALSSAGRLDKDSTGLVLLTDDGALLHKIISPKKSISKKYKVTLKEKLTGEEAQIFASGHLTFLNDPKALKPAKWLADGDKSGIMELQEGRFHQIRRMFKAIGNEVLELHRFAIGNLLLDDLPEGQYRVLNEEDIVQIFNEKGM